MESLLPIAASSVELMEIAFLQASIRTSDLLNVLVVLSQTPNDLNPQQVFNNLPNAENHSQQLQLLVGDAYYKAKGALLSAEQIVLRFIRFKVVTDQPHKYALKMCNSLGTTQSLVRFSIRLLNDCMVYTNIVLYVKPELLACGSVYSASIMLKEPLSAKEWWRAFNVELGEVEDVGHRLVDMMVEILAKGKESLGNL